MSDRANRKPKIIKIPGPDHPITIERNAHRIVVVIAGRVVADTRAALTLREASYPPVQYIPLKDVDTALLERTDHATYCPYKGDCAYYSIPLGGERSVNAVWTYEAPYAAVAAIKDHVAFHPDRVDAIEERPIGLPLSARGVQLPSGHRRRLRRASSGKQGDIEMSELLDAVKEEVQ